MKRNFNFHAVGLRYCLRCPYGHHGAAHSSFSILFCRLHKVIWLDFWKAESRVSQTVKTPSRMRVISYLNLLASSKGLFSKMLSRFESKSRNRNVFLWSIEIANKPCCVLSLIQIWPLCMRLKYWILLKINKKFKKECREEPIYNYVISSDDSNSDLGLEKFFNPR